MSTRRLPVILFVSRFECPLYPVCLLHGVPVVAGEVKYFNYDQWRVNILRL